jgi:hypothetical protein
VVSSIVFQFFRYKMHRQRFNVGKFKQEIAKSLKVTTFAACKWRRKI